jgi:hypothetical protein
MADDVDLHARRPTRGLARRAGSRRKIRDNRPGAGISGAAHALMVRRRFRSEAARALAPHFVRHPVIIL